MAGTKSLLFNGDSLVQEKWLIAVDLDGTLFHTDRQISNRTMSAMHMVVERGHSVVIVTGRSSYSSTPKLLSIPDGIRMICSNGAYEYDREKKKILWANCLPGPKSVRIREKVLDKLPSASFGWESPSGLCYEPQFIKEAGGSHTLEQGGIHNSLSQSDVIKIFVRTPEQKGGELANSVQALLGNEAEVSSSGAPFAEITAAGINKGNALAKVAKDLGFKPDRTLAFGDNYNDVSMLRWAGESVAMGNAIPELQAIASTMTFSNAEDGVAQFLENKFGGK